MPCWNKSEFNSDSVGNNSGRFLLLLPRHKTPGIRFRSSHLLSQQTANTWYFFIILLEAYYGCRQNFLTLWGLGERQWITAGKTQCIFFSSLGIIFDLPPPKTTFLLINPVLFSQWRPKVLQIKYSQILSVMKMWGSSTDQTQRICFTFPHSVVINPSLPLLLFHFHPHCPQDRSEEAGGSHSRCNFVLKKKPRSTMLELAPKGEFLAGKIKLLNENSKSTPKIVFL